MAAAAQMLLIELGTEELPVKALPGLAEAFLLGVRLGLEKRGIAFDKSAVRCYYSPRRLALQFGGVAAQQPEQRSEVLGPYLNVALDAQGAPTPALKGFAQKNGVEWQQLARTSDAKGERFVHRAVRVGAATTALLPEILHEAVKVMPIPKPMRWGAHEHAFARPLHWLVLLFGVEVVPAELFGIRADRFSRGHRFHHPGPVRIAEAGAYVEALRAAQVLADAHERRRRIRAQVEAIAQGAGLTARIDEGILAEVNCLVEWPTAILCSFERDFLAVPQEALIATMEANQKFFPVLDAEGRLSEKFIGVANIASRDEREIRKGYERVIRPRFADAKFFFDEDRKQGLAAMNAGLASVAYQQKLGTVADKVARVAALAEAIAGQLGLDAAQARRAAELAKADLQSRLVNEFPELQGIAGRYYAAAAGEATEVAAAIDEAYMPRFAGDAIARSRLGQVLAIAERLDTLAGGFAAGLKPSGNKDPFALRRNALGLARTLIEAELDLGLGAMLEDAVAAVDFAGKVDVAELRGFVLERLRAYYGEQGVSSLQFDAVAAVEPATLRDFDRRLKAVQAFASLPEAEALAAANKRIRNILRKAMETEPSIATKVNNTALVETVELALAGALAKAEKDTDTAIAAHDYVVVLKRLAALRTPVDEFFDKVMVMAEDASLRRNRLALLKRLSDRFLAVADVSVLSTG
jgi:glycyl-tRNA synthetase beta chain